jgi:glycine/D-amino acid oxidase-like deaminating enzyme
LLDPQTWGLDPGQLVAALMRAVQAAGGSVCFPQRVRRVSVAGGSSAIALLETDGPPIRARSALVALDGYADSLRHPWHRRVFPVGSALLVTEPLDAASLQRLSPQGVALETSETFKRYLRLLPDRRLLIGGRNSLSAPEQQPQAREQLLARAIEWLGQELPDLRVAHAWPGRLGFTRTRLPIIGRQGPLVFVGGYCGHGIPISIGLGQMAGAWLAEDSELPTHALLNRLPPRMIGDPLRRLVMAGLGVFYRHRDRIAHG